MYCYLIWWMEEFRSKQFISICMLLNVFYLALRFKATAAAAILCLKIQRCQGKLFPTVSMRQFNKCYS